MTVPITLTKAISENLRLKSESMPEFAAQLKKLSAEDRQWLETEFNRMGVAIIPAEQVLKANPVL